MGSTGRWRSNTWWVRALVGWVNRSFESSCQSQQLNHLERRQPSRNCWSPFSISWSHDMDRGYSKRACGTILPWRCCWGWRPTSQHVEKLDVASDCCSLRNWHLVFQTGWSAAHYSHRVREWLVDNFDGRSIGRRRPIECTPLNPDQTPLDFWLWGYLKKLIYVENPRSWEYLKAGINEKMNEIPRDMIARATESVVQSVHRLIELTGRQLRV